MVQEEDRSHLLKANQWAPHATAVAGIFARRPGKPCRLAVNRSIRRSSRTPITIESLADDVSAVMVEGS